MSSTHTAERTEVFLSSYKLTPVGDLVPYARNARTHSPAQLAQIAASIREFGFTNPILVDGERGVIAGHGRLLAARQLGLTSVPTLELAHLTPAQRRAYVLAETAWPSPPAGTRTSSGSSSPTSRPRASTWHSPASIRGSWRRCSPSPRQGSPTPTRSPPRPRCP